MAVNKGGLGRESRGKDGGGGREKDEGRRRELPAKNRHMQCDLRILLAHAKSILVGVGGREIVRMAMERAC